MAETMNNAKEFVAEKVGDVKKPEATLADVSVRHLSRDGATFVGQLDVHNHYCAHDVPICEVSYTLRSAGREVVSGTIPDAGSLKADEEVTRLEVPVNVPYEILVSLARDVGMDWDIDYQMDVGLTVDLPVVGKLTLPGSKKGEMRLPALASVF